MPATKAHSMERQPRSALAGSSLYERDFAAWISQQVAFLRSGESAGLDVPNLVEELEGLTNRDVRTIGLQLKRIMTHMLKLRHQPERATRSWERFDPQWARAHRGHRRPEPEPSPPAAGPDDEELPPRGRAGVKRDRAVRRYLPKGAAVHA